MSKQVLVIDDDAVVRSAATLALAAEGFHVYQAADGATALRLVSSHQLDLIVTDILMPGFDGLELILSLRSAGNMTPIIVMTGSMLNESAARAALDFGANQVLIKPFKPESLVEAIRALVPQS